jgi:hypothetical protein
LVLFHSFSVIASQRVRLCRPDDRLREAIQRQGTGLLRPLRSSQ